MKKLIGMLLAVVMLLSALAGTAMAEGKDTITFAYETEPSSLFPTENDQIASYYINYLLYSALFKNTANGIEKDLCIDYRTENDENGQPTVWILTLRQDAKFCDGTPLTAKDVVATYEFAKDRPSAKAKISFMKSVEALDDFTIKLVTNGVYGSVPQALTAKQLNIQPAALLAKGTDFDYDPVGSGPYKLVKWNKGENILMTANEYYYGETPKIPNINWKFMSEGTSRTIALEAGEVDFVISVDALDLPRLQGNPDKYTVSITNGSMFTYWRMNNTIAPFNDVNFRKFLSCAIDRDELVIVALDGYGEPITSLVNVNMPGFTTEGACDYDPEKAAEYLAAWGGDVSSLDIEIVVATDVRRRMAEVIVGNLAEYGIKAEVKMTESATVSTMAQNGEYQTMIFAYTTDDFIAFAKQLYYTGEGCNTGVLWMMGDETRQNQPILDIQATLDADEKVAKITELNKLLNDIYSLVPIYCSKVLLGYNKDIGGVAVNAMGFFRVEDMYWK